MVHGRGCNPHRSLWRHWWRHNSEMIRDREKWRPPRPMKSSELSNGENRIALRQLLQNRQLRHLWCHNLGSRWKLQKMAREDFSIGAFYNITKNKDNAIKTVGRDGCPAEYRWHPVFFCSTPQFRWRPLLECSAVTLPRCKTRWNL